MTAKEKRLCSLAESTVDEILAAGRKQGHIPDAWPKDQDFHLDRVIRHICTARLMRDGHQPVDAAEGVIDHLKRALTRMAMALDVAQGQR
jgi:hypothetical protein